MEVEEKDIPTILNAKKKITRVTKEPGYTLTAAEYSARTEIYLMLMENIGNGWGKEIRLKYRFPFQADEIMAEIKAITVAVLGSIQAGGRILVSEDSRWVGQIGDRLILLNMRVTNKYNIYKKARLTNGKTQYIRHTLVDSYGNRFLWDSSEAVKFKMEMGKHYDFRATAKAHLVDTEGRYTHISNPTDLT